ncbi:hypothetical protein JAAARDRAFT_31544 [Jaapia argillacea MUCL 33604]|uniref:Uncharacterized protein n=1 Tax=Jaapia argillacea MUCL 33604 TaxID=933084 RepID=A0A067QAP4_9AGAM|nr:hypothetical protein JAAARDRAFT_31544 [Jaapia argillacea MUCL 33604]
MPRRPAPTPLRLVAGPTPPRGQPRHTLPSVPRPTFYPPSSVPRGPVTRARTGSPDLPSSSLPLMEPDVNIRLTHKHLPPLAIPQMNVRPSPQGRRSSSTSSSYSSSGSTGDFVRGPWDHSSSITVPVDLESLITIPKPAMVSPTGGAGLLSI